MKACAICSRRLFYVRSSLCKRCYELYGIELEWVKALIKIENHYNYMERRSREICFTDDFRDINGEKATRDCYE